MKKEIKWLKKPEFHDYEAAYSYLCLIFDEKKATKIVKKLKAAKMSEFKAKDVFRASKLSLLGISNSHVKKNLDKINRGEKLSPILLVRSFKFGIVIVADGYHRQCSVYNVDENSIIPNKIVSDC